MYLLQQEFLISCLITSKTKYSPKLDPNVVMTFNFVLDCVFFSIPHKLFTYIVYFNVLALNVHFVSYTISISKSKSIPTTRTAIYMCTERQTDIRIGKETPRQRLVQIKIYEKPFISLPIFARRCRMLHRHLVIQPPTKDFCCCSSS